MHPHSNPIPVSAAASVAFALVFSAFAISARGQAVAVDFDGSRYIDRGAQAADVELARAPKAARAETRALHAFGPAAPAIDYRGPAFHLGYEVKASAPSNLTVGPDKAVIEDDFPNGAGRLNDTIAITAYGDWPETDQYSVAAAVVFPAARFSLESLAYSALNWTQNKGYNDKLRHRWIVKTGGKYYVSAGFLGRTGRRAEHEAVDVIETMRSSPQLLQWVAYDPATSIFADLEAPKVTLGAALNEVTEAGFYMDALDFPGAGKGKRQWQLRLISFRAQGAPSGR